MAVRSVNCEVNVVEMKICMPLEALVIVMLFIAFPGRLLAAETKWSVNVNVTLTEEGKKLERPTPEHPAYYQGVAVGYREEGLLVAEKKPPAVDKVVGLLNKALVQQGYVESVMQKTPAPSLLLCYYWGTANPLIEPLEMVTMKGDVFKYDHWVNKNTMLALVHGERDELTVNDQLAEQEASEDRYFVVVAAYDYRTAVTEKKKKLLWIARISAPSQKAASLEAGLPSLIESGAPFFGREAIPPQHLFVPVMREGRVEVGTPTVRPDVPAEASREKKPSR